MSNKYKARSHLFWEDATYRKKYLKHIMRKYFSATDSSLICEI